MASDQMVGELLRVLVASRPAGQFLELGTGIGASLCWLLDGMDENSRLVSLDNDPDLVDFAGSLMDSDARLTLLCQDGNQWIESHLDHRFDLIFADTWPGKYNLLEATLQMVKPGGFYVVDDMLPQANWPEGHAEKASALLEHLKTLKEFHCLFLNWSTGIVVCTRKSRARNPLD